MNIGQTAFYALEVIGVLAFALSGAITAIERELDVFGVTVMGVTTAMGGGVIRDVLIGSLPPSMFYSYEYILAAATASLLTFIIAYIAKKKNFRLNVNTVNVVNNIFDAIGLGTFSVLGVSIAIDAGYSENMFLCVTLGLLTGVGGGALRDVMSRSIPFIFTKRVYAVASLTGCIVYYYMTVSECKEILSVTVPLLLIFFLRMLATIFKWSLPKIKLNSNNTEKDVADS